MPSTFHISTLWMIDRFTDFLTDSKIYFWAHSACGVYHDIQNLTRNILCIHVNHLYHQAWRLLPFFLQYWRQKVLDDSQPLTTIETALTRLMKTSNVSFNCVFMQCIQYTCSYWVFQILFYTSECRISWPNISHLAWKYQWFLLLNLPMSTVPARTFRLMFTKL